MQPICYIYKTCANCDTLKHRSEFYLQRKDSHILMSWCKICANKKDKEQRERRKNEAKQLQVCVNTELRTCKKCGEEKLLKCFNKSLDKPLGRGYTCKICVSAYDTKRRDDPEFRKYKRDKLLEWHKNNPEMNTIYLNRRRAKRDAAFIEDVALEELVKRDSMTCYLCLHSLDSLVVEHILPLSKNGHHAYYNTSVACKSCNSKKSNKLPHELPDPLRSRIIQKLEELNSPQLQDYKLQYFGILST